MIELSPEIISAVMLGGILVAVLVTGYPLALAIGGVAFWVGIYLFGPALTFEVFYSRSYDMLNNYVLLAVPGFVLMGAVLEHSGAAEGVFEELYVWFAGLRGGLALATIILGTIVAATVGVIAASVTLLTLTALPSMVNRGYDRALAAGAVCAGGSLGILIPPSIMLVIYGPMANISVGKMLFAAFLPGFFLSASYCLYIIVRCFLQPHIAPAVPPGEIARSFPCKDAQACRRHRASLFSDSGRAGKHFFRDRFPHGGCGGWFSGHAHSGRCPPPARYGAFEKGRRHDSESQRHGPSDRHAGLFLYRHIHAGGL